MDRDYLTILNGKIFDYEAETHTYKIDGVPVPSITQLLAVKFGHKYDGIPEGTLQRAADAGTRMHEAIEDYITEQKEDGSEELRNFKFLMKQYEMTPVSSEIPVILYDKGKPFAAGRFDLLLEKDGNYGLGDLKHTATLDKEYLAYQLNLYKAAYEQTYLYTNHKIEFLVGIHLRGEKRKLVALPINYTLTDEIITEWRKNNDPE